MRKIPKTRAGGHAREEVLEVEPDDHAPARVRRRRACGPSGRGRTRARPSWTGIESSISCSSRRCSAFSRGFGRSITRGGPDRARQLRVAVVAQPLVAAPPARARGRRRTTRARRLRARGTPRGRPPCRSAAPASGARHHRRVEERLAQDARRQAARRQLVDHDLDVGRELARAVERRAVIGLQHLERDGPQPHPAAQRAPRPRGHRVQLPLARQERGGQHVGRARGARITAATTPPDGSRRACAALHGAAAGRHAMLCCRSTCSPQGTPGDAPLSVRARAGIVAARTILRSGA